MDKIWEASGTFWFCVPLYWLPTIALGLGPSEAVKAVSDFLLMIACGPGVNVIAMLGVGVGEVGTWWGLYIVPEAAGAVFGS